MVLLGPSRCHGTAHRVSDQPSAAPQIGILLRNRPGQVAAFLGVLLGGGTVVVINPSRGDDRTRADIAALQLPLIIGEPDDLATLVTPATPTVSISGLLDDAGGGSVATQHRARFPARRRGADVDQRNHRSPQTDRPQLRHAGAQCDGRRARARTGAYRAPARRRDRQLAAGAYRRCVPGAAMRRRGETLCAAGTFRAQRVGRGGAQAPTPHGIAGTGRIADGVALRPAASRPGQASAPSPAAPPRYRPTMPTPSPRSTASRY